MRGERWRALTLLLAMVLVLSSCRFRFPGSTAPLLKIGLVAPFEGRFRARGYEVLYAVRLAVRQWNEAGGVGGYRVELVALDDSDDMDMAVQQVLELAVDRDVMGVIGHFVEDTTLAAAPEYVRQELALVAPGVGAQDLTASGWVVRLGPSNCLLGEEAARYAVGVLSAARLAVLRDRGESPSGPLARAVAPAEGEVGTEGRSRQSLADAFVAAVQKLGGSVVLDESVAGEGWVSRLADAAPDVIFLSLDAVEGAEAMRQVRQAGVEAIFLGGPALGDQALIQVGGTWAGAIYLAAAPAGLDLAGGEAFVAGYRAMAGYLPGSRATLAYEAAHLLLEAIARAVDQSPRQPSREAVWQQLAGGYPHEGLLGTLSWDSDGEPADWPVAIYRIETLSYPGRRLR